MYELALLLAAAGYGVYRLTRAQAAARRYLEESGQEAPLEVGHLSPALARAAIETRTLRIALESAIRAAEAALRVDPTRTVEDVEALDAELLAATRALGEWLALIEGLPAADQARLEDLGGSPAPIRAWMAAERWSVERSRLREAGRPTLDARLREVTRALRQVEGALQAGPRGYR